VWRHNARDVTHTFTTVELSWVASKVWIEHNATPLWRVLYLYVPLHTDAAVSLVCANVASFYWTHWPSAASAVSRDSALPPSTRWLNYRVLQWQSVWLCDVSCSPSDGCIKTIRALGAGRTGKRMPRVLFYLLILAAKWANRCRRCPLKILEGKKRPKFSTFYDDFWVWSQISLDWIKISTSGKRHYQVQLIPRWTKKTWWMVNFSLLT